MAVRRCVVILLWLCAISASVQAAPSADQYRSSVCEDFDPIMCIIPNEYSFNPLPDRIPGPFPPTTLDQIRMSQWKTCCRGNN